MNMKLKTEISPIHNFNRFYTNTLDLIDQHILKSEFFLSEMRALHEIEKTEDCTSKTLSDTLYMDMGYLSRIIRKLKKCGFTRKEQSAIDGRVYNSYITDTGRERMTQLNNVSSSQIAHLLKPLPGTDYGLLTTHMAAIETLLTGGRDVNSQDITVRTRIRPGDIGYITYPHDCIYQEEHSYSTASEHYVASSFVQFISQHQPSNDRLRRAEYHGNIIGCIDIAGHGGRTQLRWFLVNSHYQGPRLGKRLLQGAIAFSREAGYQTLFLDTAGDLDTAIAMYQKAGFRKRSKKPSDTWRERLSGLEFEMSLY